jgi:hypothetical protein
MAVMPTIRKSRMIPVHFNVFLSMMVGFGGDRE